MKLPQGNFRLYIGKKFFTEREVGHWNRLSGEVVTASRLGELKEHLYDTLFSDRQACKEQGVALDDSEGSISIQDSLRFYSVVSHVYLNTKMAPLSFIPF